MVATAKWHVACSRRLSISSLSILCFVYQGDEMNMHVPQSLAAAAELEGIMAVRNQIVSPENNGVMVSLCQDSLLSIFLLTRDHGLGMPGMPSTRTQPWASGAARGPGPVGGP